MTPKLWMLCLEAFGQTLYMVSVSGALALIVGMLLGVILFLTRAGGLYPSARLYRPLSALINATRSLPFIILMIVLLPLTRVLVGTSIGVHAAIIPLTLGAIPFVARLVESAFLEIPHGILDMAVSLGATPFQIVTRVLLPEALPALVQAATVSLVSLVGYSAMAGAIGAGGLGDLAIRYGYQRFNTPMMLVTVAGLLGLVQGLQMLGDTVARRVDKRFRGGEQ